MFYSRILRCDISNGPGFRCTLFCSGCKRGCPGCFNPEAQNPEFGQLFDDGAKEKIFKELSDENCDGLSLLGGEPMSVCSDNRRQIIQLCKEVKRKFPNKTVWLWSGYTFEEIAADPYMKDILLYIDVLVDGPFLMEKKDLSCPWRGSSNQRVIDVPKTMQRGSIVEIQFNN